MDKTNMRSAIEAWYENKEMIAQQYIPTSYYYFFALSDDSLKDVLKIMRQLKDYADSHPDEYDRYRTSDRDYSKQHLFVQELADYRGIVVD